MQRARLQQLRAFRQRRQEFTVVPQFGVGEAPYQLDGLGEAFVR